MTLKQLLKRGQELIDHGVDPDIELFHVDNASGMSGEVDNMLFHAGVVSDATLCGALEYHKGPYVTIVA